MKTPIANKSVGGPGLRIVALLAAVAGLAVAGCGPSGPPTYPIAGTVTFAGKPLPTGTLTLIPASSKARTTVAKITDGAYATEITEGEWTVNIQAVRETGPPDPKYNEAPREQYLPAKYNNLSKIKVTSPVEGGTKDFDLTP